ncbi:cytochrome c oxidase subunit 3 [Porticoccaceae bacterium]|jgi:cytochrome c oxidase subunit 3|nr:cytochrome c oxidase subunit 3 [Porticoccaceae bacterium]
MSTESSYYVPEQSKLPIITATGMGLMAYGAASWVVGNGNIVFTAGLVIMALVMFKWWSIVIDENMRGLANDQLKQSYVLGMLWFIFSEVMFFAAFFGALFYLRVIVNSWLGGDAAIGIFDDTPTDAAVANNALLWPGYEADWPPMVTPDQAANGANATFTGPDEAMSFPGWSKLLSWLPLWNTVILVTSSITVHIAHTGLKNNNRKQFIGWLGLSVLLGIIFLVLQVEEYVHAYQHMGLTLESGIYGTTFFMLTGFHGAHVTLGTIMLLIALIRAIKGHFSNEDQFGFEAASWYWHFVDVVWILLFFVVYVFD